MFARENLPLQLGERPGFTEFLQLLEPRWTPVSRGTVTTSIRDQATEVVKRIRTEILQVWKETDVSCTTDMWTSHAQDRYCTLSMHWLTSDWVMRSRILGTVAMNERHTAANISRRMLRYRAVFGMWPRDEQGGVMEDREYEMYGDASLEQLEADDVFGAEDAMCRPVITTDLGSNVGAGVERRRVWDWNKCACHMLHLAVHAGLQIVKDEMAPARRLATKLHRSPVEWKKFKAIQEKLYFGGKRTTEEGEEEAGETHDLPTALGGPSSKPLRLVRPVKTRWNSMYMCLKRLVLLKAAVQRYLDEGHGEEENADSEEVRTVGKIAVAEHG